MVPTPPEGALDATPQDALDATSHDADRSVRLPTLDLDASRLEPLAIVVGDPARARAVAERLEGAVEIGANREYVTLHGRAGDRPIVVCSHGVGAAGANVCFAELLRGGVRTLIRAGTCGAIRPGIADGDVLIATSAVREDAVSEHLIPPGYPAVADRHVVEALARAAAEAGLSVREGMIVTEANFYPGSEEPRWTRYPDYGPMAVEMEMSSLFVMASMHGARAGGIVTVDGNLVEANDPGMSDYDPHREVVRRGVDAMLDVAVAAAAALEREVRDP